MLPFRSGTRGPPGVFRALTPFLVLFLKAAATVTSVRYFPEVKQVVTEFCGGLMGGKLGLMPFVRFS